MLHRSKDLWVGGDGSRSAGVASRVFGDDLLQCDREDLPWKHLDILLDISGLGIGKSHDDLEELLSLGFGFGDSVRLEALQVAANTVLLLDCEARGYNSLEKRDCVDTSDICLVLLGPPDATYGS